MPAISIPKNTKSNQCPGLFSTLVSVFSPVQVHIAGRLLLGLYKAACLYSDPCPLRSRPQGKSPPLLPLKGPACPHPGRLPRPGGPCPEGQHCHPLPTRPSPPPRRAVSGGAAPPSSPIPAVSPPRRAVSGRAAPPSAPDPAVFPRPSGPCPEGQHRYPLPSRPSFPAQVGRVQRGSTATHSHPDRLPPKRAVSRKAAPPSAPRVHPLPHRGAFPRAYPPCRPAP